VRSIINLFVLDASRNERRQRIMTMLPADQKVDARPLENLFEYKYLSASYKLFWFLGIYKEILQNKQKITFRRIVCRMIASAWYPLLQYHLNFGYSDKLKDVVSLIHEKYQISSDTKEEELLLKIEKLNDTEVEAAIKGFYNLVPYRLLSPFFSDTLTGKSENDKNKMIVGLSLTDPNALYQIIESEKAIYINDNWFEYICQNQNIVFGWFNYKLISYLQKNNPNVPAIPFKLSAPNKRNLSIAKNFWSSLACQENMYDVYTGIPLTQDNFNKYGNVSIDHFIPWSFVLHDELWNLVPTFRNINSSKSNKLPKMDLYMDKFCEIQYTAFCFVRGKRESKKILEDYLTINNKIDINALMNSNREINKNEFSNSLKSTVQPLYQIAYNQGYELWDCNIS
jgi:hypothetical protein